MMAGGHSHVRDSDDVPIETYHFSHEKTFIPSNYTAWVRVGQFILPNKPSSVTKFIKTIQPSTNHRLSTSQLYPHA